MALDQQVDNKEVDIMPKRTSRNVKCPFYHGHDGSKIKCEGLASGSTTHLVFSDPTARSRYQREKCNSIKACQTCLLHKALYAKWGMDDE